MSLKDHDVLLYITFYKRLDKDDIAMAPAIAKVSRKSYLPMNFTSSMLVFCISSTFNAWPLCVNSTS